MSYLRAVRLRPVRLGRLIGKCGRAAHIDRGAKVMHSRAVRHDRSDVQPRRRRVLRELATGLRVHACPPRHAPCLTANRGGERSPTVHGVRQANHAAGGAIHAPLGPVGYHRDRLHWRVAKR